MAQDTWSNATFGLSIASLVCSVTCAIITFVCIYKDRIPRARPWFRLSLSISLATIVSLSCQICTHTSYINMRPNMQLRAILWLYLASELFVSLLTTCVVVHVLLTIATVCTKLAHRVQKWYDVGALSVALIATHPVLYVGRLVEWDKELHTMRVDGMLWVRKWHMWVVFLVWISVCILANVCLVSVVACKMLKYDGLVSKQAAVYSNPLDGHLDAICQIRKARRRVQFVALRLSCYALVPIFTHVWTLACAMSTASWLLNWAPIMASTQGIIFLFLLAINPACDELWLTFHTRMSKQECTKHETLRLDFAQLDASTIHLSPYQSRSSMTV